MRILFISIIIVGLLAVGPKAIAADFEVGDKVLCGTIGGTVKDIYDSGSPKMLSIDLGSGTPSRRLIRIEKCANFSLLGPKNRNGFGTNYDRFAEMNCAGLSRQDCRDRFAKRNENLKSAEVVEPSTTNKRRPVLN